LASRATRKGWGIKKNLKNERRVTRAMGEKSDRRKETTPKNDTKKTCRVPKTMPGEERPAGKGSTEIEAEESFLRVYRESTKKKSSRKDEWRACDLKTGGSDDVRSRIEMSFEEYPSKKGDEIDLEEREKPRKGRQESNESHRTGRKTAFGRRVWCFLIAARGTILKGKKNRSGIRAPGG